MRLSNHVKIFAVCICFIATSINAQTKEQVLAEREGSSVSSNDHRAIFLGISDEDYRSRLVDSNKLKLEIEDLLAPKIFAKRGWPFNDETDLEKNFRLNQTQRAQLEIALAIVEKRAKDELKRQPAEVTRRAREIYAKTEAPQSRRAMSVDFQQVTFDLTARSLDENVARIKAARDMIASGESFDIVAKKYSDDPAVLETGGQILGATSVALDPQLSKILIDALKPNEVSDKLITTRRGIHIVKLLAVHEPQKRPFEEIQKQMEDRVVEEAGKVARSTFLEKVSTAKTNFNEPAIDSMLVKVDPRALEIAKEKARAAQALRIRNAN
jgi:parvulin-like peptidyl-prolyl isomerase